MITLETAKSLSLGMSFKDDKGKRWRVNGKVQTWKTDPNRIKIPVKSGLYEYGYITEENLWAVTLEK